MTFATHILYSNDLITSFGKHIEWIPNEYEFRVPIKDSVGTEYHEVHVDPELIDFLELHDFAYQPRLNRLQLNLSDAEAVFIMMRFGDKANIVKI